MTVAPRKPLQELHFASPQTCRFCEWEETAVSSPFALCCYLRGGSDTQAAESAEGKQLRFLRFLPFLAAAFSALCCHFPLAGEEAPPQARVEVQGGLGRAPSSVCVSAA